MLYLKHHNLFIKQQIQRQEPLPSETTNILVSQGDDDLQVMDVAGTNNCQDSVELHSNGTLMDTTGRNEDPDHRIQMEENVTIVVSQATVDGMQKLLKMWMSQFLSLKRYML